MKKKGFTLPNVIRRMVMLVGGILAFAGFAKLTAAPWAKSSPGAVECHANSMSNKPCTPEQVRDTLDFTGNTRKGLVFITAGMLTMGFAGMLSGNRRQKKQQGATSQDPSIAQRNDPFISRG